MSHSNMVRYYPEHYLLAPVDILWRVFLPPLAFLPWQEVPYFTSSNPKMSRRPGRLAFRAALLVSVPLLDVSNPFLETPMHVPWQSSRTRTFSSGKSLRLSSRRAKTIFAASLTLGIFLGPPELSDPFTSLKLMLCLISQWDTRRSSLASVAHLEPNHELFPTPHMQDRALLATFVHEDQLVIIASSHKIVLWDPSSNQLTLQEFYHPTRGPGYNPQHLTAISAASRAQFSRVDHTFALKDGVTVALKFS
ncbi:hypothetical protein B0H10DRAFT_1965255 [Mycena sp. CBHHK59/15]|nr:hypothetical protein B0H10DRAFT_1965255 [Mycena sp. CBHHK59/15]